MRHATRLALVLTLLSVSALFPVKDAHSACPDPSCSSLDGRTCTTDQKCWLQFGSNCIQDVCRCFASRLVCP